LNPKIEDPERFEEEVRAVCGLYHKASDLSDQHVYVLCTDEKTGIQAKEHAHDAQPMKPGQVERVDPEYVRHGTSGLIASRDVATGKVIAPLIQPTRTEADFVHHIRQVIAQDPEASYCFVMDQLNTHKSEALVLFVAEQCGIDPTTLGQKGKDGILKSMDTRMTFLSDAAHRVRIQYTPKHCSWLNQIECWFSILTRRLLNKRSSFISIADLETRISQFIAYYNEHLAKPFRWNYKGKLLKV
jgi:transposase